MKIVFTGESRYYVPPDQQYNFCRNGETIHCNVDWLIEDYQGKQAELVNVNEIFKPDSKVNPEYAMKTDTSKPIIIVRFDDGTHEILDGNNRLFKAAQEGQTQIMAHILSEAEMEKYIF